MLSNSAINIEFTNIFVLAVIRSFTCDSVKHIKLTDYEY